MDIIVIKKEDGSISSSPFHIRFGTLKILKTKEKIVTICIKF
jgi:phosphatidate phosphatase PAH1